MTGGIVGATAAAAAGTAIAGASGWASPTGLAAFITACVGAGAFIWSIYQAGKKRHEIDVEAAVELIEALEKKRKPDED